MLAAPAQRLRQRQGYEALAVAERDGEQLDLVVCVSLEIFPQRLKGPGIGLEAQDDAGFAHGLGEHEAHIPLVRADIDAGFSFPHGVPDDRRERRLPRAFDEHLAIPILRWIELQPESFSHPRPRRRLDPPRPPRALPTPRLVCETPGAMRNKT